ncbi:hypothetical protein DPMN_094239 [Dreissena polymorpha]|uniref:Uncharacterized protein n=1 Tax=Dreissena polymorpha TaxID=45954 RepID=A0A9D4L5N3_DREPO|nr:hypothetical protein DPMN_094239 [Dreissena polymorpha]
MGNVMNKAKLFNYVLSACASAPRSGKTGKQEDSRWVHVVNKELILEGVSGLAVYDIFIQVCDQLQDAVERLTSS